MSAAFQAVGSSSETSVAWPTHADDDIGVLCVETASGTVTTPSGWTVGPVIANAAGTTKLSVFLLEATSGAMGNAALAGGSDHLIGFIFTIRGAPLGDVLAAIETYATAYATAASTTGFAPGVDVKEADCHVVHILAWAIDDASDIASAWTNASLASITERLSVGTVTGGGGGVSVASGQLTSAGYTGIATVTLTSTTFASMTLVFRSAPTTPYSFTGTITIAGSPASNGESVEIWDDTLGERETTVTVSGGAGGYTANVQHNDASRYRAVYDDGASRGCSPLTTAS